MLRTTVPGAARRRVWHPSEDYQVPFKFTGTIAKVAIKIGETKLTLQEQAEYEEVWGRGATTDYKSGTLNLA